MLDTPPGVCSGAWGAAIVAKAAIEFKFPAHRHTVVAEEISNLALIVHENGL